MLDTMVISQYLGRGSTSRGRITITSGLTMIVSDPPYLKTDDDKAAVIAGIKNLQSSLAHDSQITWLYPTANQTIEDFVDAVCLSRSTETVRSYADFHSILSRQVGEQPITGLLQQRWVPTTAHQSSTPILWYTARTTCSS
jgi:hypothetical protein